MEVKKGYKQTEVGVIPQDWQAKCLQQLANPVRGGSPRPAGDPKYFDGNYIPWLTVAGLTNIPESQLFVTETQSCLTEEGSLRSRTLDVGTLIIANSGATLGVAKILGVRCCANDGIAALLNLTSNVSPKYVAHFVNTKTRYLRDVVATGNGQPNLNTELIGNFRLPLPPTLAEQESIATALSDADAWIESLEQLIAKKRQIKQGAMQELLTGKRRLPGFSGEWVVKRLDQIGEAVAGLTYAPSDVADAGTLVLRASNIQESTLVFRDNVYVEMELPERVFVRDGDILICVRNGSRDLIGKCAKIDSKSESEGHAFGAFMCVYRTEFHDFIFNQFQSYVIKRQVHEHLGATINQITNKSLNSFEIPIPPLDEQKAIATVLSDMDTEIAVLETKLTKARQIKQGMMQELLTGKIRLI